MGRAPCCDKANVKKGPWSPEEDAKLKSYINQHGTGGNWIALPQKIGLKRCGKSCRLRWLNYLRPNIKHGGFSEEEDNIICNLYISIGSRWSIIAAQLPGRTDNDIKNYWNTRLKKKILGKQRKERQARTGAGRRAGKHNKTSASASNISADNYSNIINPVVYKQPHDHDQVLIVPPPIVLPPIPYSNEEPRLNDHLSIRKLLIKLGGRFSDHELMQHPQDKLYMSSIPSSHDLMPPNPLIPFNFMDASLSGGPQLINNDMNNIGAGTTTTNSILQEQSLINLEPLISYIENPQKLQGLHDNHFFYHEDSIILNGTSSGICGQSVDAWGEMNSLAFPTAGNLDITNNEGFVQPGIPDLSEDFAVQKMRYPGTTP